MARSELDVASLAIARLKRLEREYYSAASTRQVGVLSQVAERRVSELLDCSVANVDQRRLRTEIANVQVETIQELLEKARVLDAVAGNNVLHRAVTLDLIRLLNQT